MPDPRNASRPADKPHKDTATTGDEPAYGTPTPRVDWSGSAQVADDPSRPDREPATPSDAPSTPQAEIKKGRALAKPPPLQSLGDLLRATYGGAHRRLNPKKAEYAAIRSRLRLEPSEWEELLGAAASDRTLARTRELMLLNMERFDASVLAGKVREFVWEVLRRHPAFLAESLAGVLENRPNGPSEEDAVRTIASQSYAVFPWPKGLAVLKKNEAERCRVNALCCLLLWFRETRGITFERTQHYLQTSIWTPAARQHKTDAQKLRVLMNTRDSAGMAVACSVLERQAVEQSQQAAAARRAEQRAAMRTKALEDELDSVKTQLETAKGQIGSLAEEIDSARRAHENERALMSNEYEQLRGRVLHRLREEVSLLDEGLHALRRDPPKVHVMEDHAERVVEGLKREMERIKGDD